MKRTGIKIALLACTAALVLGFATQRMTLAGATTRPVDSQDVEETMLVDADDLHEEVRWTPPTPSDDPTDVFADWDQCNHDLGEQLLPGL